MLKNVKEYLNAVGKYIVQQSRSNLSKLKKNTSKTLYNSIEYNVSDDFKLDVRMEEYGHYQDKGVSGTEVKYNTKFKYGNKMPPIKDIAKWAKAKNIRLRDDKGRFKKGDYNTIGFIIARSIHKKGIKPSLFFTKPFEKKMEVLNKEMTDMLVKDLEVELKEKLKQK